MVKKQKRLLFSDSEIKQIEAKVKELETKTSGEIVIQVIPTSDTYLSIRLLAFLIGLVIASGWALYSERAHDLPRTFGEILFIQIALGLTAVFISYIPVVARLLVPKEIKSKNTQREALALFTKLGVHGTRERTGVLILISAFERQVTILADSGIHQKVAPGYWKDEAHSIAAGFREKNPAGSLIQSLDRISAHLTRHFPVDPSDRNELSDDVRF